MNRFNFLLACILFLLTCPLTASEPHLRNLRQLTFGGNNAEAYWSPDGKLLVFQSDYDKWGAECDRIYVLDLADTTKGTSVQPTLVSTGTGRTTCSYFLADGRHVLYASTHASSDQCPAVPEKRADGKYVWPVYPTYDIWVADLKGELVRRLTNRHGYDAEATVSPRGDKVVFTSDRSGDLELWTMSPDGSNLRQVTDELGYDGGAFFSPDGTKLVFRSSILVTAQDSASYRDLLNEGQVTPTSMEIFVCNADGSNRRQITRLGKSNWAPFFHPTGNKIIFSSNHHSQRGYNFQLFLVNLDGTGLEQITKESIFNAFPVFSPDGRYLVFSSNRNNGGGHDTNLFLAEWVD